MIRRRSTSAWYVAALLATSTAAVAQAPDLVEALPASESPILASYDFEQPTPSGPDTFWLRDGNGGEVALSSAFRFSGERSLHLTEDAGNRDFAEFLAYFDERREGSVYVQFYLLLTDTGPRFNFGIAGSSWFLSTERHGQAVWLQTEQGMLQQRSGGDWHPLFEPATFVWYFIDLVVDIDGGTYDLRIFEEGLEQPRVDLRAVPAMHGAKTSSLRYLSLIGDLEDEGRFDYFVDDLLIASDPALRLQPFVAPGRRTLFVDRWSLSELSEPQRRQLLQRAQAEVDREPAAAIDDDWLEQAGDEAFHSRQLELAGVIYQRLARRPDRRSRMLLKLADVAFLQGDLATERTLRERIYGRLDVEP